MSSNREASSQRYARLHKGITGDFNPRDEMQREASATRQANELARARAMALHYVRLPKRKLPAMMWVAHQLGAMVRKGGVAC